MSHLPDKQTPATLSKNGFLNAQEPAETDCPPEQATDNVAPAFKLDGRAPSVFGKGNCPESGRQSLFKATINLFLPFQDQTEKDPLL